MKPFILFSILALAIGGHAKVTNGPSRYQLTDGWHKGNDGFMYRCSTEEKSFNAAQDTCKKWGGNLAMEKTQETRVYLSRMYSAKNIWCGVKRDMRTRGFSYITALVSRNPIGQRVDQARRIASATQDQITAGKLNPAPKRNSSFVKKRLTMDA